MRLVIVDIVDQALLVYPTVTPTFFVDDLSEEPDGEDDDIVYNLGGFTQLVVTRITDDGMEVSATHVPGVRLTPRLGLRPRRPPRPSRRPQWRNRWSSHHPSSRVSWIPNCDAIRPLQ